MKPLLFISIFTIITTNSFSQDMMPPPPPPPSPSASEIANKEAFIRENKIENIIKGNIILHSNKYFTITCKNKGKIKNFVWGTWLYTSKNDSYTDDSNTVIMGQMKEFYFSIKDELKYFGFTYEFDSWNIEKIANYYFTYNPAKSQPLFNKDLKNAKLLSKSNVIFDGKNFVNYKFSITDNNKTFIEDNYLTVINNYVFIFHQRKSVNDNENIMNTFKLK